MKTLLIVYHSLTGGTLEMASAAAKAASAESEIRVSMLRASEAGAAEVPGADGYLFAVAVGGGAHHRLHACANA